MDFLQVQLLVLEHETSALHHKQVQYMHDIHVTLFRGDSTASTNNEHARYS